MIVGIFIGANLGFLAGCIWTTLGVRREVYRNAQKRGRLP